MISYELELINLEAAINNIYTEEPSITALAIIANNQTEADITRYIVIAFSLLDDGATPGPAAVRK